jgi:histidinol-phosphate aminotransferase
MSPHPSITPQPGILDISLYVSGKARVDGVQNRVTKLSANENPYGPGPAARAAYAAAIDGLAVYPETDHAGLRGAIGAVHGLDPARIICGVGSDEIIHFLCQCYAGPGGEVLFTEHGFAMYRIAALAAGATPVEVAERDRHTDVDALLAGCTENTRLVFIANPNNPTGTMISRAEVARLADGLPAQAILVLDGAYAEFVPGFDGHADLATARDNVVMTRTFSKIYGLGGLRIGWGYGPRHIIDVLNRIRGPFNLGNSQLAVAEAAVSEQSYVDHCRTENIRLRDALAAGLAQIGIASDPSHANFILVRFADATQAQAADTALKSRGLIVRYVANYGLPQCLRITIGDDLACQAVLSCLTDFMKGQSDGAV